MSSNLSSSSLPRPPSSDLRHQEASEETILQMIGTSTMEEWLRQQAESLNANKVTTRRGIGASPVLYFSTWRSTHSDILSVVNTARLSSSSSSKSPRNRERRRVASKRQSPLQSSDMYRAKVWKKQNDLLRKEEQIFMSNLDTKRFEREDLELGAATSIQKCTRAYLLRRWFSKEKSRLKAHAKLKESYRSVTRQLMLKKQMEANLRSAEHRKRVAAVRIQNCFRQFLARRAAENEKERRREEAEAVAATLIQAMNRGKIARRALSASRVRHDTYARHLAASLVQRIFRGFAGRRRAISRRYILEILCATMIQRHYRRRLAFKFMKKEKMIREVQRLNDNAVAIQAIVRGNNDRRLVAAMRRHEILLLRHAAALNLQRAYRGHLGRFYAHVMKKRYELERRYRATLMLQRCIRGFVGRNIAKQRLYKIRDDLFAQIRLGRVDHVMKLLGGDGLEEYGLSAHDESGNGVVHKAAMWGHTRLVKKLCQMGANLNAQNHKSKTAAQLAVERGWEQVAEYLIEEQKCEIEFYGRTLLHDASLNGMFGVVLALIYRGIKIDERDDETERTSLVEAARGGHVLVSKLLLEYGADPNLKDEKGRTALHYAATSGSEDLVKVLVNAGARFDIEDSDGHTAWRLALSTCQNRVQKFFLKCWRKSKVTPKKNKKNKEFPEEAKLAAINAARRGDLDTVREIVGKGSVNISEKSTGNTIFMGAAESGSKDVIDFCLHRGCDVNRTNYFGETALHRCSERVAAYLVKNGALVDIINKNGQTPLFHAVSVGHVFKNCTLKQASVRDMKGRTPIFEALIHAQMSSFERLLKLKVNVKLADNEGMNLVHHAVSDPKLFPFLKILLARKTDPGVSARTKRGETALHLACKVGNHAALGLLLVSGFLYPISKEFLNCQDENGATAIRLAIDAKSAMCVQSLLSKDCDATLKDETGTTPVRAALLNSANKCAKLLFNTTASVISEVTSTNLVLETAKVGNKDGLSILMNAIPMTSLKDVLTNVDDDGFDVMALCVVNNMITSVQDLIKSKCSSAKEWRNPDDDGNLLHLAVSHGVSIKILDALIGAGVQTRHGDCDGVNPIHVAAKYGHKDLVNALAPLSVDLRDGKGMTAVHYAAQHGRRGCLEILIKHGHHLDLKDEEGKTPVDYASSSLGVWISSMLCSK